MKKEKLTKWTIQIVFWVGLWAILSDFIAAPILLPSPLSVMKEMLDLSFSGFFWSLFFKTFANVFFGLLIGLILGLILVFASFYSKLSAWLIEPMIHFIKTTPIAAMILVLLIWLRSASLPMVLVILVVIPAIYLNIWEALTKAKSEIVEVLEVYKVGKKKSFRYVYFPIALEEIYKSLPFLMGFSWKSGVSGEIMAQVKNSFGNEIYLSKIYLETARVFAFVILLVIFSVAIEKLVLKVVKKWQ